MEAHQNRYAPPQAPVADFHDPPAGPCPHIELVCRLLWISFGVSLVDNVVKIVMAPSGVVMIATIIGSLIGAGIGYVILSWITRKLRAGRNWMRWLYTVLSVVGWVSIGLFWSFYRNVFSAMTYDAILSMIVSSIIGVAVIVLLHTPVSRDWFRAHAAAA